MATNDNTNIRLTPTASTVTVYSDIIGRVHPNAMYVTTVVDVTVPFEYYGVEFSLEVTETGVPVIIEISRSSEPNMDSESHPTIIRLIPKNEVEQVRLPLSSGVNEIHVSSVLGDLYKRIGVANFATHLFVFSYDLYDYVLLRLETRENVILSRTGSLLVERWFSDVDLLSKVNSLHRLFMRLLIDGFYRATTQKGVEKITTAITSNTPIFKRTLTDDRILDTLTTVFSNQEEFAGYDTHVWLLDMCAISFIAAGKYLENLSSLFDLQQLSETSIGFKRLDHSDDRIYALQNYNDTGSCSVENLLLSSGCFDRIRPWVRISINTSFKLCFVAYPFDLGVERCYALGTTYYDCENLTMEEDLLDPTVIDLEDAMGNGWIQKNLSGRWDYPYGSWLDTMDCKTYGLSETDVCPYLVGPVVTPLMADLATKTIAVTLTAFGWLEIFTVHGPILLPV